jgi:hypothetical protein
MFTFPVEVVLKGRDVAVTENVSIKQGQPSTWDDRAVRDVLVEVLRAIDRVQNPQADPERLVILQGFSWIVEPFETGVVIALEIPMGAAVAGPFVIPQAELDARIARVLRAERQFLAPETVH